MPNSISPSTRGNGPPGGQLFSHLLRNGEQKAGAQLGFILYSPVSVSMLGVYKQCVLWLLPVTYCCPGSFLILEFSTTFECFTGEIWQ